jgi:plasmid stabilization system protein ParE
MALQVRLTHRADREADEIYLYIRQRAREGALRWYEALQRALADLKVDPSLRALSPEGLQFGIPVRQILFKTRKGRTYRALYTVDEQAQCVNVLSIRGASQDLLSQSDIDDALKDQ